MSIQFTPDTPATRQAFNRLAREKMKLRLLADIRMDLMVCELEGWSKLEYLDELLALAQELRKGGRKVKKGAEKVEFIDTKKITSELLNVLSGHDLAVADAIRMLEMTKNKILIKTKLNPQKNA